MKYIACFSLLIFAAGANAPIYAGDVGAELRAILAPARANAAMLPTAVAAETLRDLYAARAYEPVWLSEMSEELRCDVQLISVIREAEGDGLAPQDYQLQELEESAATRSARNGDAARRDLLCTEAFLLLAKHVRDGRIDSETGQPHRRVTNRDLHWARSLLNQRDDPAAAIAALRPQSPLYETLRAMRRDLARAGADRPWPTIEGGPTISLGMRDARLVAIVQQLGMLQLLPETHRPEVYDRAMVSAIEDFQKRFGLLVDGHIGRRTVAALNISPAQRLAQIDANLERMRWLPQELGRRYVLVNIAAFELDVVDDGATVLRMKIIAGKPYRSTPVFSDQIRYLVFNPSWDVPPTILQEDILPELRRDLRTLARKGFDLLAKRDGEWTRLAPDAVNWSDTLAAEPFPYRLRLPPGPTNPLGKVKFMFPNAHDIYLHDTPDKALFRSRVRDLSSGCIRIENARALAAYFLPEYTSGENAELDRLFASKETRTVFLPEPVPIHIQYWTVAQDDAGSPRFFEDVYERDAPLARALRTPLH